ncbi:MAG: hypothetical protein NVS1B6_00380 [Steroidobacteraceae bacterium]
MRISPRHLSRLAAVTTLSMMCVAGAAVLPDDRADLFWSSYKGGGMDITGESLLVRKKFSEKFSVEANYFVDKVSGASVDVLSQASVIKDERKQKTISVDYIHDKTQYNLSYSNSTERDYISNTTHFALNQDMFGDLTTVTLGFTDSRNKVGENNGSAFKPAIAWLGHATSRSYEGGLSQVITKNLIAGATVEIITDQGFLSNPYRPIRYRVDPSISPLGYALGSQVYPNTHTTSAAQARAKYYLPYRAAASVSYRYFTDTWGIHANTIELEYTQPVADTFIFEGRLRHYSQNHANFYSDLFPFAGSQNFEGRDRNLAASTNDSIGAKVTWAFAPEGFLVFKRATATVDVSRIQFKYRDFRNIKDFNATPAGGSYQAGAEPLYTFDAMVYQAYISMFF